MGTHLRSLVMVIAASAAMLVLILWLSGVFKTKILPGVAPAAADPVAKDAALMTVATEMVAVLEEAAGTVQAERKTTVSSRLLATIRSIEVNAGGQVERGQVLIRLDSDEPRARVGEARRLVEAARATRDSRAADFARARQLLEQGVVSQSEFDRAEESARVAEADWERAQQLLSTAEITLAYAEIVAPVSGRVIDRFADPGDTATPGKPLLSIYDPSALRVEVPVRESLAIRLQAGDALTVRLGSEGEALSGVVDEIVPQAEAGSRTFLVKVGLPPRQGLYTGMFARVLIPAGERRRMLIPEEAVERVGQLVFVNAVDAEGRPRRQLITLGAATSDGRVEVLSGIHEDDRLLIR